ncbi:hypothetical protein WOLCODRAFT_75032 [Wolfiporia cocos MD-104 SS10]|uniref:DUF5648 domain-containing protein n=1 Tax=Wolfiporia cocos (strain MD-104) TaxID=742152 RepID=A0A2H3JNI5_WOLCO|nr:hypothetical protein WOLCODRAFT_75032 [Wolfiporia cocos MD-104 SS10]
MAACAPPPGAVPFLRAYSPSATDHFYTTNATEMDIAVNSLGYSAEGNAGYIYNNTIGPFVVFTVALYRMYSPSRTDHYYTTSYTDREAAINGGGYNDEGIAGYVYNHSTCYNMALYEAYSSAYPDHFYTQNISEMGYAVHNLGYDGLQIGAYVLPYSPPLLTEDA